MNAGLLSAEWTKIRSVRSTLWSLLAFVVVAIGFSALIVIVISNTWNSPGNHPNHVPAARRTRRRCCSGPGSASASSPSACSA